MTTSVRPRSVYVALSILIAGGSQALAESAPGIQEKMSRRSDTRIVSAQSIGKRSQPSMPVAANA